MLERLFQLFFKYRPVVFQRGDVVLDVPSPVVLLLVAGVAAAAVAIYARRPPGLDRWERGLLSGLRVTALAVLAFCLARPVLVVSTVVPQQNFLGILIDDSRSMQIADRDGAPRSSFVAEAFGRESALRAAVADRFKLRYFRFADGAQRLDDPGTLSYQGPRTELGAALDLAQRELASVPLAGLVVVTDGADNGRESLNAALLGLQARGVPVYTVALGVERFDRDVAVERVTAPRTALQGATVALDVALTHRGLGGETVRLTVEDGGSIVAVQEVTLPRRSEALTIRTHLSAEEPGPRRLRVRVAPQEGEAVTENNQQEVLLAVEDATRRILYFEGEPRFEVSFLRRAVAGDDNLQLIVLQRTADEKFLRLDVDAPDELVDGFPRTREELFRYDGLVLGSVEASYFTRDQLRMIADFVSERGGGLLALGGQHSFTLGGYAGTPVADVLPVEFEAGDGTRTADMATVRVTPTAAGLAHPVTQLAATADESQARWEDLPPLSVLEPIREVKPGASTLLAGRSDDLDGPVVVLASQRYGRGMTLAFTVQDSWLWQMHGDVPLEDMTHETFWRQMLRWLVSDVPSHIMAAADHEQVGVGEGASVTARVSDSGYVMLNGADVTARVTAPDGVEREIPLEWTVERDGEYRAGFPAEQEGLYEVHVAGSQGGRSLGEATTYVLADDGSAEFQHAESQYALLERIAEETGGRFYTDATVQTLPEDVSFTESGATVFERRDLWDMPVLLLALIGLLGAEWAYRRRRGLA